MLDNSFYGPNTSLFHIEKATDVLIDNNIFRNNGHLSVLGFDSPENPSPELASAHQPVRLSKVGQYYGNFYLKDVTKATSKLNRFENNAAHQGVAYYIDNTIIKGSQNFYKQNVAHDFGSVLVAKGELVQEAWISETLENLIGSAYALFGEGKGVPRINMHYFESLYAKNLASEDASTFLLDYTGAL